jgi:hypothetical protein
MIEEPNVLTKIIQIYKSNVCVTTYLYSIIFIFIFFIIFSGVRPSPLGTAATADLMYQPQMLYDGDCGEISTMKIGRKTEVLGENLS